MSLFSEALVHFGSQLGKLGLRLLALLSETFVHVCTQLGKLRLRFFPLLTELFDDFRANFFDLQSRRDTQFVDLFPCGSLNMVENGNLVFLQLLLPLQARGCHLIEQARKFVAPREVLSYDPFDGCRDLWVGAQQLWQHLDDISSNLNQLSIFEHGAFLASAPDMDINHFANLCTQDT